MSSSNLNDLKYRLRDFSQAGNFGLFQSPIILSIALRAKELVYSLALGSLLAISGCNSSIKNTAPWADEKEPVKAKPEKAKLSINVSVTGAASALRRITSGGASEYVTDSSDDNQWLLLEVEEVGKSFKSKIIQKFNLRNRTRVLLTPKNSINSGGVWNTDLKSFIFTTDRLGKRTIVQSLGISGETGVRFITQPSLGHATSPDVNPKKREVAFSVVSNNYDSRSLSIVNMDGSNLRMYGAGESPKWSPTGKELVFHRKVGEYYSIYAMNPATGSDLVELSSSDSDSFYPVWSPSGKYIAFISNRVAGKNHLFIMSKTGQSVTQITNGNFNVGSLTWGKKGNLYFSANAGGNWDIWSILPKTR